MLLERPGVEVAAVNLCQLYLSEDPCALPLPSRAVRSVAVPCVQSPADGPAGAPCLSPP